MRAFMPELERVELVARFGNADLVRTVAGKYELRGGTPKDREDALAWIRMFCPDVERKIQNR